MLHYLFNLILSMTAPRQTRPNKVDVVYLWVDGSDQAWQAKRQRAYANWLERHPDELAIYGNNPGRYRDNGELRFNLRSIEKFFPNHGHIYIVTDGQTPSWLRPSKYLTLIDHLDLLPQPSAGVFDSGHIESYLHHIPGLSEKFFYLNDDVFFGTMVDVDWWFGTQLKVFAEASTVAQTSVTESGTALVNASIQSRDWLLQQFPSYLHDPRVYSHAPRPMLKSAMLELEALAPQLFKQVRSTTFRSWSVPPIVPDLVPRWMVQAGYAQQRTLNPLHISTGTPQAQRQFELLVEKFGHIPFFCINDTSDESLDDDPQLLRITNTLEKLLPEASSFEWAHESANRDVLDAQQQA